jgi:CBS domain-containing protein
MITAREIMTMDVVTVREDTPIREAVELLLRHNISGLPVVRNSTTLVGILTEKDVLRLIDNPHHLEDKTVSDFMTTAVISFELDTSVQTMCACLRGPSIRRLPVTQNDELVGIVSRRDIIQTIMRMAETPVA